MLQGLEGITMQGLKRIYREKIRSSQFIAHSSYVADYYLFLLNDSNKTKQTLHFFTKSDLLIHPYMIHPLPDAYFARVDAKGIIKRYFVEIIDEGTPRFALRRRMGQYNDYVENGTFEKTTKHPFPNILFICPNVRSLIYLKKYVERMYEELSFDYIAIYLATREGAFSGNWEKVDEFEGQE
jgi:hypothetical protein